jgi:cell wall-active antibiotic response 4TMS protein YvqF
VSPAPDSRGGGLSVSEGPGGDRWVISVMGGHDKKGRWRLAPRCTVVNFMGGSDIDLNDAELSQPVTEVNMYSIMGGGEIRVPHGVEVHVSNFAFMGGNEVELGDEVAPPGAPVIRIKLVSIMGGSGVKRGRKLSRAERKRERELRKANDRELER